MIKENCCDNPEIRYFATAPWGGFNACQNCKKIYSHKLNQWLTSEEAKIKNNREPEKKNCGPVEVVKK